jgi:uncharacterized Zn-finger protein
MTNTLLTCTTCDNTFRSRHDLNYHVRRDHQTSVKIKFQTGDATEVKKGEDNRFKCKCGKKFKLPDSLRRHAKSCNDEEGNGDEEDTQTHDSDASNSLDLDEDEVDETPIDCYGALISGEIS